MNKKNENLFDYQLLDTGKGLKLEQVGKYKLVRPSTLAIWKQAKPELWNQADSIYNHKHGWSKNLSDWEIQINQQQKLICRLQSNGQIGIFPEHYSYLNELSKFLKPEDQVLSLFAYTGLATVVLSEKAEQLTHVDISKKCLNWAKENLQANSINNVRLISEDAIAFLNKEIKRDKKYQLIILDPPSFSRISKNKTWDLDQELVNFCELTAELIDKQRGLICFTSHLQNGSVNIIENLFRDIFGNNANYSYRQLNLTDHNRRELPCSGLNLIKVGQKPD